MALPPVGTSLIVLASSLGPTSRTPTALVPSVPSTVALSHPVSGYQVTVLDQAAAQRPRHLIAKTEIDDLPPGIAPDAPGVELNFSIKVGGEWRNLGNATTDPCAFARLPFPRDVTLAPGHYEIAVRGLSDVVRPASGRLLITGDKPTLMVAVDGGILRSRPGISSFIGRNLLMNRYEPVPGAEEALQRLSEHYQIVYVAPLRDESTLANTRYNLFEDAKFPAGPILTNDFGLRLKEYSRAVSHQRLAEFMDNTIAELRGFDGVGLVGGIGRTDRGQTDHRVMERHCLETRIVPNTTTPWWQFWKWFGRRQSQKLLAGKTAWHGIQDHFLTEHERLAAIAHGLYERRFHADPHVRFQTELDLVSGAYLCMGNTATLYTDGQEAFNAVTALFKGAETVFAEIYEFGPDTVGNAFADIFSERASSGKHVRLTSDFIGSKGWSPSSWRFFGRMAMKGVRVSRFNFALAEFPDIFNAFFFRTHRKVAAVKVRDADGRIRDVAVLGGRNWRKEYWDSLYDNTVVVSGPVMRPVVEHLEKVTALARHALHADEKKAFAPEDDQNHPDNLPLRYVFHYPKNDENIKRAFLSMLNNPNSDAFIMETSFPLTTEIMRDIVSAMEAQPEKQFIWIVGTHDEKSYGPLDAFCHAQGLILKKRGMRVLMRGPLNEFGMSPMHVKTFSDLINLYVGSWNPDEQSNKDLESGVIASPDPQNPATMEKITHMLQQGLLKDVANGLDLEEWLTLILPETGGGLEGLYRRLLVKLAPEFQEKLNYFL